MTNIDVFGFLYSFKKFSEKPSDGKETCSKINEPDVEISLASAMQQINDNAVSGSRRLLLEEERPEAVND